ncbi:2-pyrone-4,6-dicarbaxylate hydrolase [Pigmentiphaga humi]|uniref:2-pyrone-4,6-dicarbaxylate hydrolase n=1 Tax=Pigmentiphaga humi TaxID=2478468 RepID=A0A3P4BA26_9BURK|nr:amidohydrolase family protein [Pigmentiphaga humi]VCU72470.1 2-pyrone-4,6-dicarbaxylate hydrolase [Pigmentiphaga humi]
MAHEAVAAIRQAMPPRACDCHTHVIGAAEAYPMAPDRHYTPGPASAARLRRHLEQTGMARVVVVQPSVYGTDNTCLLDALRELDGRARGVAVIDSGFTPASLRTLHDGGVRGVRVNLESGGLQDVRDAERALAAISAQVADLGWHVQLYAAYGVIEALAPVLAGLPCPVVLDHFAMAPWSPAAGAVLADLLRSGRVHLKLSAPYRLASQPDAAQWARMLGEQAPSALLWGSDWPHTARAPGKAAHEVSPYRKIGPKRLLADLARWLPTEALRQAVLADNPDRLYWR